MRFTEITILRIYWKLKELSKTQFETNLTIALSQNKIILHLEHVHLKLQNIYDYKDLKFDTVKELQNDLDQLFTEELYQHKGTAYVSATIPNAIVEPDPWEDYDNYVDYDLFDTFYNEKSKDSLTLEQKIWRQKNQISNTLP